ncbi:MAG: hypothetical protein M1834_008902 [Cirrosporium novae-zelandiae]|nr:MAG: hypothetical protein M1834_008902 [Cirrosporium novae-zelandiae]
MSLATTSPESSSCSDSLMPINPTSSLQCYTYDLELMHHFSTETCFTLSDPDDHFNHLWQIVIPKDAFFCDYLRDGLLSLSAIHFVSCYPDKNNPYLTLAITHQNTAISSYRRTLGKITPANCSTLFAFSAITIIFALSFPQLPGSAQLGSPVEEFANVLLLIHGAGAILNTSREWIKQGELGVYLQSDLGRPENVPPNIHNALDYLQRLNEAETYDDQVKKLYSSILSHLMVCYQRMMANPKRRGLSLVWALYIEPAYVPLIKGKQPMALLILAHYIVSLDMESRWWSRGWAAQIIPDVSRMLGDEWQHAMHWPMEWVKTSDNAAGFNAPETNALVYNWS